MTTLPTTISEHFSLPVPPRGGGSGMGGAPTAGDILAMLRRRTVLIVVLFMLFTALLVGGFVAWWVYLPGYQSECLVECKSDIPKTELTYERERLKQEEQEQFVRSQAVLLKLPATLAEALKVTAVRETQWYRSIEDNDHVLELKDQLAAAAVRGTNLLRVSLECRDPKDPAVIVNAVVNQWLSSVKRRSAEEFAAEPLEDAREEISTLEQKIEQERADLRKLAAKLPAGASHNPGNNITAQKVASYGEQVAALTLDVAELSQYRKMYENPQAIPVTAEDRAIVEQDPQVAQLVQDVFFLEQQLTADQNVYGDAHKEIQQTESMLAARKEKLTALRTEKLNERRRDFREATNTAYANKQFALLAAQENLARAQAELEDQDQLLLSYDSLGKDIEEDLAYRQELLTYIKGRSRVVRQQSAINVSVAQYAIDPLERSSPKLLLLPVGVFLALALSLGIALSLELMDKSLRTSQDVVRYLDVPLLGAVPDTDDEEVKINQVETAMLEAPQSMVAEAFRRIRTNLHFSCPADRQRCVVVTSPRPRDGKTTVACNLAIAVAQGGRRVLLVDADFRRPSFEKIFQTVSGNGLSNILIGDGTLDECVCKTEVAGLDVLGAGRVPPNPVELLGTPQCHALLEQAKNNYDQIIIATVPVLLASDALVLSAAADGVILVARAKQSSRGIARRACILLSDVGAHLFGVVLNAAQVTRGGYFREQQRTYYDYQVDADTAPASQLPLPLSGLSEALEGDHDRRLPGKS